MENLKNVAPIEDFNWDAYENGESFAGASHEELEKAYDGTLNKVNDREVVDGTVIAMNKREVVVNIGYKSDGIIPLNEFRYNPDLKVGDTEMCIRDRYKIRFIPRSKSDQLVGGYMIVSSDVWSVREIRFSGRSELLLFSCLIKMGSVGKDDEFLPVSYNVEGQFNFLGNRINGVYVEMCIRDRYITCVFNQMF